jgi:type IV pilus assembly protein PilV
MTMHRHHIYGNREHGMTMLEVLITIVILAFGLLGLAGLQGRMQVAEFEAYQRTQAVVLLQEMVDRLKANPNNSMSYVPAALGTTTKGTGSAEQDCTALPGTPPPQADIDLCEWHNALLGAAETSGVSVGAMIGARGCVTNTKSDMPREFLVSVVWQGMADTATPISTTCGQAAFAANPAMRRALVARVTVPCLQNVVGAVTCVTP